MRQLVNANTFTGILLLHLFRGLTQVKQYILWAFQSPVGRVINTFMDLSGNTLFLFNVRTPLRYSYAHR